MNLVLVVFGGVAAFFLPVGWRMFRGGFAKAASHLEEDERVARLHERMKHD